MKASKEAGVVGLSLCLLKPVGTWDSTQSLDAQ